MIKKILYLFIISAISVASLHAQVLTVSPSDTTSVDTLSPCQAESILVYDVTNSSSDTLQMNWRVIYNTLPHGWSLGYCYQGTCLTSGYIGHTFHYTLTPGASSIMQLDATPSSGTDSGYFQVETWATGDSAATATFLTYYVALTTPANCAAGISEVETSQVSLYPNPARNDLKVTLPQNLASGQVDIYNLLGSKVYSQPINTTKEFDISSLETGIYMVRVSDGGRIIATKKFTKID